MAAAEDMPTPAGTESAPATGFWGALKGEERPFHVGLACAFALHALLIAGVVVGFTAIPPDQRRMGERDGALDGISVVLVDEADFRSRNTVPLDGSQAPSQPNPASQPAQPKQEPAERTPEQQKSAPQQQTAAALAKETPNLLTVPDLTGKPPPEHRTDRQEPKQQQRQEQARRPSVSTPPSRPIESYPAFSRPAGITRSGENDDFARGVIRALRQTMPPGRGSPGRVTIRFLLSDSGNLVEVRVVATSADAVLTQNVVFASKQSSFPFPPRGATVADRTFLVTYVYE